LCTEVELKTGVGIFEVLAHICRSPLDAFKQFVENAADAIEQAGEEEGLSRIEVEYETAPQGQVVAIKSIVVEDNGIGMSPLKMRQVLQQIGNSEKLNCVLRGEKGVGILAFALIAAELHLCSTDKDGVAASCLVLKRNLLKAGLGEIREQCPLHIHSKRGTKAYIMGISPEVAAQFSKQRLKDYLSREFANDLQRHLYTLLLGSDHNFESIQPQRFRGIKVLSADFPLGNFGHGFAQLYALPVETPDAMVSLYGRGGARICHLVELGDFKKQPWMDQRLEGYIRCDQLRRTADKTAVVQDGIYRALVAELTRIEPQIVAQLEQVSQEYQERRLSKVIRRTEQFINKFLRYMEGKASLEELMPVRREATERTGVLGRGALLFVEPKKAPILANRPALPRHTVASPSHLIRLCAPPLDKAPYRSWYDATTGTININSEHVDFLEAERHDRQCLRYLFTTWAKEYLLAEYGADAPRVADEMVGLLAKAELPFSKLA
jgi:hypothetical protein